MITVITGTLALPKYTPWEGYCIRRSSPVITDITCFIMVITPVITVITLFRTMPLNSYSSKNHQPPPRKEMSEKVVLSNKVPNLSSLHLTQNQHRKISPWQLKPLSLKSNSPRPPCTPRCAMLIPGWGWAQDRKARDRKYWTPSLTKNQHCTTGGHRGGPWHND